MPAMWCWPQPFGQPLILMSKPGGRRNQVGARAKMIAEQLTEAARLRDGQAAGLGAGAARDVRERVRAAGPSLTRRRGAGTDPGRRPRAPSEGAGPDPCVTRTVPSP